MLGSGQTRLHHAVSLSDMQWQYDMQICISGISNLTCSMYWQYDMQIYNYKISTITSTMQLFCCSSHTLCFTLYKWRFYLLRIFIYIYIYIFFLWLKIYFCVQLSFMISANILALLSRTFVMHFVPYPFFASNFCEDMTRMDSVPSFCKHNN